ncbi:hypothetical protein A4D02_28575 [Niastella koreensis]|uniref:Lipoprotein n=2 Tax=Niastella koreensis TaxID=354356 RepID=G8T8H3_NIAKG|nr:hypothetical protein [Niastella koreensis]AEW00145.1 hypothetical protein Niako_3852 [Niastella koreensis GR20-10]OQP49550.1 hypothetical protein A4D02_28575 [Niastella koreensis]
MKKFLLLCFIYAIGLSACQKGKDSLSDDTVQAPNNTDSTKTTDSTKNNGGTKNNYYVTATINGKDSAFILADGDTSSSLSPITVYGYTDSTKKKYIWFGINKKAVGTYKWSQMGFLDYPANYGVDPYMDTEESNIVIVTYIDDKVVEGTFSGVCFNDRWDPTIFHTVPYTYLYYTNGKFRARIMSK